MKFKQQSIQLISLDPIAEKFIVNNQAIEFLQSLNKPLSIISVSGVYRTGKSYLINEMLIKKSNAFKVGSTTQALTKGIWIWGSPILAKNNNGEQFYHIIMDSEGIGSTDKDANYDCKILLLIFLLSSTVIYNTVGSIDQLAIQNLRVVIQMKKCIKAEESTFFPYLIWILRDFSLQLVDRKGRELTQNEYLQNSLEQSELYENDRKKNEIRRIIKTYFKNRECFTLIRPIVNQEKLQNLESQDKSKLRPQFLNKVQYISNKIMKISQTKKINNQQINGIAFTKLIKNYVTNLNIQKYPDIVCSWEMVTQATNRQIYEDCINKFEQKMRKIKLPQDVRTLKNSLKQIETTLLNQFTSKGFKNKIYWQLIQKMKSMIKKTIKNFKERNEMYNEQRDLQEIQIFYNKNVKNQLQEVGIQKIVEIKELLEVFYSKIKQNSLSFKFYYQKIAEFLFLNLTRRKLEKQSMYSQIQSLKYQNQNLKIISQKASNYKIQIQTLEQKLKLKQTQQNENLTTIALNNQKIQFLESQLSKAKQKLVQIQQNYQNMKQESNIKNKMKQDQLNNMVKKLKQENIKLCEQKQTYEENLSNKNQIINENPSHQKNKEILESKLKQCFQKFQEQRQWWKQKEQNYKKSIKQLSVSIQQKDRLIKQQNQSLTNIRVIYLQKQQFFQFQVEQLKKTLKQTKLNYQRTNQTLIRNNEVFKNIENIKNIEYERSLMKKSKFDQIEILEAQIQKSQSEINFLKTQNKKLVFKIQKYEQKLKQQEGKSQRLQLDKNQIQIQKGKLVQALKNREKQLFEENEKLKEEKQNINESFQNTLVNITKSREKERTMYQQSIKRLLINIEKKQLITNKENGRMSEIRLKAKNKNDSLY